MAIDLNHIKANRFIFLGDNRTISSKNPTLILVSGVLDTQLEFSALCKFIYVINFF
jgi:hypothetical protein